MGFGAGGGSKCPHCKERWDKFVKKMEEKKKKEGKMFEDAKEKDKVWSSRFGWGEVDSHYSFGVNPLSVRFKIYPLSLIDFTEDGKINPNDKYPTLFHNEIEITPPPKPKKEVIVELYVNLYPEEIGCFNGYAYRTREKADLSAEGGSRLGEAIHIVHKYRESK